MIDPWTEWLRVFNLALATISFVHMLRFRRIVGSRNLSQERRDQWWIWTIVSFALIVSGVDGQIRDIPVTWRNIIGTVIVLTLIQGIYIQKLWPLKEQVDEDVS